MPTSPRSKKIGRSLLTSLLLVIILCPDAPAQTAASARRRTPVASAEARAARYFESARSQPLLLAAFLRRMPKGADLHNHLSGAIYAESYVRWAAESNLCVSTTTFALSAAPCDEAAGRTPVSRALTDPLLYRQLIDAWSMRNWELSGQSGHDHFFDTFGKFGAASATRTAEMLAEALARAAAERLSYLELMYTPDGGRSSQLGRQTGWNDDFGVMRERLLAAGLREALDAGTRALAEAEQTARTLLKCGTSQPDAGCGVTVRYVFQVGRAAAREQVFAQMLAAFEMAERDPRIVALNLVQPEDWLVPMRDFRLHMRMLNYLRPLYRKAHITLHAGELAPGLVPPEELRYHIRESVSTGHAERIGHGVAVMYEDDPFRLLDELARRRVLVEVCLTSNDVILGVRGTRHPLALYLKHGVPVALATDDLGVARSDMTREYLKAAEEQGLGYMQLKAFARASLEHSFVGGASLWRDARRLVMVDACADARPENGAPAAREACRQLLAGSEKARLQWELERAFAEFEREF
ncbi:MAG TPA: hypothetical protein VGV59_00535 [Pyrinomonadaceae bacterium]|nr:hypothetical protein [Pyrinomonadaceae bacterium]